MARREAKHDPQKPGLHHPISEDADLKAAIHGWGDFPPAHEWAHSVWVVESAQQHGTLATQRFIADAVCQRVLDGQIPWFVFSQQRQAGLDVPPEHLDTLRGWAAFQEDAAFWGPVLA